MPDINFFWLGYYKNGMTVSGSESIKNIPNLEEIKLLEVYIKDEKGDTFYHLGVGLESGYFYVNDVKIDPAPFILNQEPLPVLRPIFFIVRDRKMTLFSDGRRELSDDFVTVGIRVGWQTTIDGKNHQRMITWIEGWDRVSISDKR